MRNLLFCKEKWCAKNIDHIKAFKKDFNGLICLPKPFRYYFVFKCIKSTFFIITLFKNEKKVFLKELTITHAVFPHILISAKCEYKYWIFCGKSETAKFENISHKNRSSDKNFWLHVKMVKLNFLNILIAIKMQ